jgi:hypothetical protein
VDALLYLTVWVSLSLFALAEIARDRTIESWPRAVSAAGLALMIVHILIAMGVRHGWQHAAAVAATAHQTNQVYGVEWGWGIYVNYAFVLAWCWMVICWVPGCRGSGVPWCGFWFLVRVAAQAFFAIVIANAAVVFATGWRRLLGVSIMGILVLAWSGRLRSRVGRRSSAGV